MSLGFLTEEQASRVVQAQSQGRQFLPLCGFSVPLLILLANWETPVYSALGGSGFGQRRPSWDRPRGSSPPTREFANSIRCYSDPCFHTHP